MIWGYIMSYKCDVCKNSEHVNDAHYCKICGTKIEKQMKAGDLYG